MIKIPIPILAFQRMSSFYRKKRHFKKFNISDDETFY